MRFRVSIAALRSNNTTRVPNLLRGGSILLVRLVIVVSHDLLGQKALIFVMDVFLGEISSKLCRCETKVFENIDIFGIGL